MDQIISNSARTSFFNNELVVTVVLDYLVTLLLYYLPTFLPSYLTTTAVEIFGLLILGLWPLVLGLSAMGCMSSDNVLAAVSFGSMCASMRAGLHVQRIERCIKYL